MLLAPIMRLLIMILQTLQFVVSLFTGLTNISADPVKMLHRICLMLLQPMSIGEVLFARFTVVDGTVNLSVVEMFLEGVFVDRITITVIAPSHVDIFTTVILNLLCKSVKKLKYSLKDCRLW